MGSMGLDLLLGHICNLIPMCVSLSKWNCHQTAWL
jgi:hypothetical protein